MKTSDWNSLNDDQWLTNFVLDSCLLAIIKESGTTDCYSMPVQVDNIQFDKMQMLTNNQPDFQSVEKRIYNSFLATLGKNATLWKYKEISNRDLQKDAVSCKIFVLMYSAKILKNEPLINLANPNDFRKEMNRLLLKHRGDKHDIVVNNNMKCPHCHNFIKATIKKAAVKPGPPLVYPGIKCAHSTAAQ
ncbi:hypothetical protein CVS40_11959 [Lucilia cuprina]|nr:hypothetical protein CVS40_11959 [Lucilia cuprina]